MSDSTSEDQTKPATDDKETVVQPDGMNPHIVPEKDESEESADE